MITPQKEIEIAMTRDSSKCTLKAGFCLDRILLELAIAFLALPLECAYFFESSPSKRLSICSRLSGFLALVNTTE
jgi:hypothetical protein